MPELTQLDDLDATPHAEVFDEQAPRTVRLSLDAGEQIPAHHHPDSDIVLLLLSGRLALHLDDETYDVEPNDAVRFSGERAISPEAREDSVAVVLFAPRDADASEP